MCGANILGHSQPHDLSSKRGGKIWCRGFSRGGQSQRRHSIDGMQQRLKFMYTVVLSLPLCSRRPFGNEVEPVAR